MGDDGIGVHVIQELQKNYSLLAIRYSLEFIDGGTSSLDVLLDLDKVNKLVIVDAVKRGGSPGNIYKLCDDTINNLFQTTDVSLQSLHDFNLIDALTVYKEFNNLPKKITLIGVEPKEIKPSLELSSELKSKMPEIIKSVLVEVNYDCITTKTN